MAGLKVIVWLAPLGRQLKYSLQSPCPSVDLPPNTLPTELALAVGPLISAPLDGQIAFERIFEILKQISAQRSTAAGKPKGLRFDLESLEQLRAMLRRDRLIVSCVRRPWPIFHLGENLNDATRL